MLEARLNPITENEQSASAKQQHSITSVSDVVGVTVSSPPSKAGLFGFRSSGYGRALIIRSYRVKAA